MEWNWLSDGIRIDGCYIMRLVSWLSGVGSRLVHRQDLFGMIKAGYAQLHTGLAMGFGMGIGSRMNRGSIGMHIHIFRSLEKSSNCIRFDLGVL
ncbi:hypothetical protein EYC80_004281 [Monilinia laxa]|uniref:Uncharacterized protein n=1 Tax=Monilinia laxa TaxID=61186 RepID=A0A5N6KMI9_MONLA|nr:hypothetical protein EYC80_004281 [Monilinia laxa]